jgi:sugar/nucleoside kinase (ribokinase family)
MTETYDLVAIARPFVDVIADIDEEFLKSCRVRKGAVVEVSPRELIAIRALLERFDMEAGGSLSNTAAGMAALGARTAFLGKVCDDKAGLIFRNAFTNGKVHFPNASHPAGPDDITATCLVLRTPDGQGTVIYSRGVSDRLTSDDLYPEIVRNSRLVYFEGNLFSHRESEKVFEALDVARQARRSIVVTLHAITDASREDFEARCLPHTEILFGNAREFGLMFGVADLSSFAEKPTLMVMTAGENGVFIAGRGHNLHIPPHRLGAKPNTVGAGDQFAAGFLWGYIHGLGIEQCAELGGEVADTVLDSNGARPRVSLAHIGQRHLGPRPQNRTNHVL